ncbi:MAG: hypothetical protein NTW94_01830, partial [Legionellales bacterium]|nr:hypothetical protein [Legionellales bacterium]
LKENPLKNLKLFKIDRAPKVRYLSLEEETQLRQALLDREFDILLALKDEDSYGAQATSA